MSQLSRSLHIWIPVRASRSEDATIRADHARWVDYTTVNAPWRSTVRQGTNARAHARERRSQPAPAPAPGLRSARDRPAGDPLQPGRGLDTSSGALQRAYFQACDEFGFVTAQTRAVAQHRLAGERPAGPSALVHLAQDEQPHPPVGANQDQPVATYKVEASTRGTVHVHATVPTHN
jgi:hypothetical protein